jgi:SH3-like domain-containing protein
MKLSHYSLIFVLLAAGALTGCGTPSVQATEIIPPTETSAPPAATSTATLPAPTSTTVIEPTHTAEPTIRAEATLSVAISVENLNLRAGPSTTYAILGSYPEDTDVIVTARVLGSEWVRVLMPDEKTGWMSAELLGLGEDAAFLPLEEVTESIVVSGRVIDSDARPIGGVTVAVLQRLAETTLRADAVTDAEGYWYAYIPKESAGIWEVQVIGADCASWINDEACNISGHFLYNYRFIFEPPPISPFLFLYQTADAHITGLLTDADDQPLSMRVFAERSDGAYVFVDATEDGQFTLPVGAGSWSVYAMQYNPNLEGERVTVTVLSGLDPEPIFLKAPVEED